MHSDSADLSFCLNRRLDASMDMGITLGIKLKNHQLLGNDLFVILNQWVKLTLKQIDNRFKTQVICTQFDVRV